MSSSEGENFDFQDDAYSDDSEDYAPAAKKTKAPAKPKSKATTTATKAKPAAAKTAVKGKGAPKKKVLADHDDNAAEAETSGIVEIDEDDAPSAVAPLAAADPGPTKKKTASETYTKLSQLEHILKRPDSYIGSVETITQTMWTYDADTKRMVYRDVKYVPGFFKIVDEILVNAADNKINDPSMDTIKIEINVEECIISVYNNGRGIPIEMHSQEKMYIPELIFGHLLSSSNYDDDEKKLTGGRNGYGAKLANIYSHEFTVETADKNTQQKYKQTWTDNMSKCGKAKITKNSRGEEWTRVTFRPDLGRFGMDRIDDDTASLLRKRVHDLAGTVKNVKVFLNDERLRIKNFKEYVQMYLNSVNAVAEEKSGGAAQPKQPLIYEQIGPRWEVAFAVSEGTFMQVSFANSISTSKGGTHVNLIADQIAKNLITAIGKKNKGAAVKAGQIKNHMWIFVNALIENPTFDSQTKETLTLPASKFGTKPNISEDIMKKIQKSPIVENILNWAKFKADQQIKKTDGSKRNRLTGLPKLSDANNAGTKHAKDCTLILTEGDSAKSLAVAGLAVVGRDNFGVFPLRGKLLNVREAKFDQIMKNEEIQNIKKIMGLQHNKDYTNISSLRYGRLMIMTDQDHDGSHIKGLLINFLDHFYPSLLKIPDFLVEFVTPIVRVTKGNQRKDFFTIPEFEQWVEDTPDANKWTAKYFKGLGTSDDKDGREYFSNMAKHMIPFAPTQEGDRELIDLAFSKKKADERKEWLRQFKPGTFLDHRIEEIPYSDFINKELILFSMADNVRSIPSAADGLKPGQRKVIWGCFKRNFKKEMKVMQLVGYVSEKAVYHHGEQSLMMTIVNLAQDFVGSNNINLLMPNGQYGTRDQGGKDHASARYINTLPSLMARAIFHQDDDVLLTPQKDENHVIEPEWYMPVLPMVLVNGAEGIGTGWSTNIPCYNPRDIVDNLRRLMNGEEIVPMHPWWRGFKGEVKLVSKNKYDVTGIATKIDDSTIEITELPIHKWTQNFKAELEAMMVGEKSAEGSIKNYQEHHANQDVHFIIQMDPKELEKAEAKGLIEYFKLTTKVTTTNMICFDFDGKIKRYDSPEAILEEFYPKRLEYYQKRKDHLAAELQNAFEKLSNQARFVQMIIDRKLSVSGRKKADIVVDLRAHKFRPFPRRKIKATADQEEAEENDAIEEEEEEGGDTDYDYLLSMPIWNLTREKIEKLKQQAADKESELIETLNRTPKDMWTTDLDKFLETLERIEEERSIHASQGLKGKKGKKKNAVLQTRKSLGSRRDDDDDDFKPIKVAPKKKAPASKPTPAAAATSSSEKAPAPKRKIVAAATKRIKDESDIEMHEPDDVEEPPKKPPKRKAAATKKIVEVPSDDDDDEMDFIDDQKTTSKSSVGDDDSDIEVIPTTGKGKGKGKAAPKRKSPDLDEDDDGGESPKPAPSKRSKVTDFFGKAGPSGSSSAEKKAPEKPEKKSIAKSMKPRSPPKAKKAPTKIVQSEDESDGSDMYDDLPKPPPRAATSRAAKGAVKKYVDISDGDDDDGDGSIFE
ncbi:dna topoisomerase ii [Moniliophthora roreri MCA 2997]|uniref:DNA topoisomerase 2 n=1 Tax=Moniliophthora roreri (strain MCA 2997) TaxID=1381753 RepID=V2XWL6_MONRO|nr:dna topoisomerase ii [Moniliophthora roreri MCA 2997]